MDCLRQRFSAAKCFYVGTAVVLILGCVPGVSALAQQFGEKSTSQSSQNRLTLDQKLFGEMRWRCIGPFRGGRTVAISGVPHQPNVFYMAAVHGGVWHTTDFGNTWNSIRRTRKPFMRRFGPLASRLGKLEAARRSSPLAVEFLSPRMEARIGVR